MKKQLSVNIAKTCIGTFGEKAVEKKKLLFPSPYFLLILIFVFCKKHGRYIDSVFKSLKKTFGNGFLKPVKETI